MTIPKKRKRPMGIQDEQPKTPTIIGVNIITTFFSVTNALDEIAREWLCLTLAKPLS
jgi:hypothetical protein